MTNVDLLKKLQHIASTDVRYKKDAYLFMLAALEYTVGSLSVRRHVTGSELSLGIAAYAREKYGYLARDVLAAWGITTTDAFGDIVYIMIDHGIMSRTDSDRQEDFNGVFPFAEEFDWEHTRPTDFPERL